MLGAIWLAFPQLKYVPWWLAPAVRTAISRMVRTSGAIRFEGRQMREDIALRAVNA